MRKSLLGGNLNVAVAESLSSVLDALPTYMVFIFPIPQMIQRLDKIRQDFEWKRIKENDSTVQHLFKWNKVL